MDLYTQRHGMREPITKTYQISIEMYSLLLKCCLKYDLNIAWLHPLECSDGDNWCGLDVTDFETTLKYEIPSLYRSYDGHVGCPGCHHNVFDSEAHFDEYDQYALLDLIEYYAINCRDIEETGYHSFFRHKHIKFLSTDNVFKSFQKDINTVFTRTGLLYHLTDQKIVERVVEHGVVTPDLETKINRVPEQGLRSLLQEAINKYKLPSPLSLKDATEKIWDAFERLKTYYPGDKKQSVEKLIDLMSHSEPYYIDLYTKEFSTLTKIGNELTIRHHETNKISIDDNRYYEYLFCRCMSLIGLAIQYLNESNWK